MLSSELDVEKKIGTLIGRRLRDKSCIKRTEEDKAVSCLVDYQWGNWIFSVCRVEILTETF